MAKKNDNLVLSALLSSMTLFIITSCFTSAFFTKKSACLKEAIDFVVKTDANVLLEKRNNLLLVVNFIKENDELRLAILPKDTYPAYISDKKEAVRGYEYYDSIIVIGYGNSKELVNLKAPTLEMDFLKPLVVKQAPKGQPPFPPFLIEPEVYSYKLAKDCFVFVDKNTGKDLIY